MQNSILIILAFFVAGVIIAWIFRKLIFEKNQTMFFNINDVKVDFVLYPFRWLQTFDLIEGTRLLSMQDVIPMKLQAISNRNAKKDYWDIAALLKQFPLKEMLKIFSEKFPKIDTGFIIHSLTDFEKADTEVDPDTLVKISWDDVKNRLTKEVIKYTEESI